MAMEQELIQQKQQIVNLTTALEELRVAARSQATELATAKSQVTLLSDQVVHRQSTSMASTVFDARLVGKIKPFNGERESWRTWGFQWKS